MALKSDISQESLTLAATWIIGEYSEVLLEGGFVDEDHPKPVSPPKIYLQQRFKYVSRQVIKTL